MTGAQPNPRRWRPLVVGLSLAGLVVVAGGWALSSVAAPRTVGPDVTVINLPDLINEGGDGT